MSAACLTNFTSPTERGFIGTLLSAELSVLGWRSVKSIATLSANSIFAFPALLHEASHIAIASDNIADKIDLSRALQRNKSLELFESVMAACKTNRPLILLRRISWSVVDRNAKPKVSKKLSHLIDQGFICVAAANFTSQMADAIVRNSYMAFAINKCRQISSFLTVSHDSFLIEVAI